MGKTESTHGLLIVCISRRNRSHHKSFTVAAERLRQNVSKERVSIGYKVGLFLLTVLGKGFDYNTQVRQALIDVVGFL